MVRADRLHIIEQYRDEQNKWFSVAWAFIGAALGILVNWVTPEMLAITRASVIVIVTLGAIGVLAWLSARQFLKRAEQCKHIVLYSGEKGAGLSKDRVGQLS